MSKIISQGAEATIQLQNSKILKIRTKKSYRIPQLDSKLRKLRTRQEAKILEKLSQLIPVPKIFNINEETSTLTLEYIKGKRLSQHLDKLTNKLSICKKIGASLAKIHDLGIIHGDPTTSNMIYSKNQVYLIDFGLGFHSQKIEDKAVDLHLIKQALEAKHPKYHISCFKAILTGYKSSSNSSLVLKQLEKVERRGRYKEQD